LLPSAPSLVTAVAGNTQATVSWTAPSFIGTPITNYNIQYSSNGGSSWTTFNKAASTSTSSVVTGLTNNVGYIFRVAAINGISIGPYSTISTSVMPNTISSISGMHLWLDAADASTLFDATTGGSLVAADGTIGRWQDKSSNGRHATQATSGSRPIRKTALINGLDAITFDGTNDHLLVPVSSVAFGGADFDLLVVARSRAPAGTQGFFVVQDNSGPAAPILRVSVIGNFLRFSFRTTGTVATDINDATAYSSNALTVFGVRRTSSTITATKNGSAFGSSALSGSFSATFVTPGVGAYFDSDATSAWFLNGEICEILAYNPGLSSANLSVVQSYLAAKWGIS
jgi:hypothetical protein